MLTQVLKVVCGILLFFCIVLLFNVFFLKARLDIVSRERDDLHNDRMMARQHLEDALAESTVLRHKLDDALAWAKENPAPRDPAKLAAWVKELEAKR